MEFLQTVYDATKGMHRDVSYDSISLSLGLNDEQQMAVLHYLIDNGFLKRGGTEKVRMTSKGIDQVEAMKEGRTRQPLSSGLNINIEILNVTGIANLGEIIGDINQRLTQINDSGNTAIAVGLNVDRFKKGWIEAILAECNSGCFRTRDPLAVRHEASGTLTPLGFGHLAAAPAQLYSDRHRPIILSDFLLDFDNRSRNPRVVGHLSFMKAPVMTALDCNQHNPDLVRLPE